MSSRSTADTPEWPRHRFSALVAACAALSVVLRLRFLFTPLTVDEGGYLAIARAWAHGKVLYEDVWVDRPQGLLALFRLWDFLTFGSAQSLRIMAMLFGVVAVFGAAIIARTMSGPRAGVLAAFFVAVLSSTPALEGFIANGELLSGGVSVACLAFACLVLFEGWTTRWMFVAGILGGLATSIKQSGADGFVTAVLFLAFAFVFGWMPRRQAATHFGLLIGGFATVWAALAIHGAIIGWNNWYYGVTGYRLEGRSALEGADWPRFHLTEHIARPILVPVLIAAAACGIAGTVSRLRSHRPVGWRPRYAILPIWLVVAVLAFLSGGQFHHHYWITLTFPIGVIAGVLIAPIQPVLLRTAIVLLALLPAARSATHITFLPRDEVPLAINGDARLTKEEHISKWYHANESPGDTLYTLCASASFYAIADEDPPYPYLWFDNVVKARGAQAKLRAMFSNSDLQPTYVAVMQTPLLCDPSGVTSAVLAGDYELVATIDGIQIMERTGPRPIMVPGRVAGA